MKRYLFAVVCVGAGLVAVRGWTAETSLETAPPVVVRTCPVAGAVDVAPSTSELKVTFSKEMQDGSWSWSTWGEENFPQTEGTPHYEADRRTCVLPVKLVAGKFYAIWLNSDRFRNFKDAQGQPAVPYLLTFKTREEATPAPASNSAAPRPAEATTASTDPTLSLLTEPQRKVLEWTERQFRGFFDERTFHGYSSEELEKLEAKTLDALKGPRSREYYQAINTLAAMKSKAAVQSLLTIATERREKDNRDRWMAVRALGLIGDQAVVPDLIHLLYHGNSNTRWWAQLSLVRLTGVNFGNDWKGWGKWWNDQAGQPPFNPEFVKWYSNEEWSTPEAAERSIETYDKTFLEKL